MTTAKNTGYLLHLLSDLTRDPALVDQMKHDPIAVLDKYGIGKDQQAILRDRSAEHIFARVGSEAREMVAWLRNEYHNVLLPWPSHEIQVNAILPTQGPPDQTLPVTVKGRLFPHDAVLTFSRPDVKVEATDVVVHTDKYGNSTLTASATFAVLGSYTVSVSDPQDPRDVGTLPNGFTVQNA